MYFNDNTRPWHRRVINLSLSRTRLGNRVRLFLFHMSRLQLLINSSALSTHITKNGCLASRFFM